MPDAMGSPRKRSLFQGLKGKMKFSSAESSRKNSQPSTPIDSPTNSKPFSDVKLPLDIESSMDSDPEPPRVSVEARLPSPPILTCNEDIPLRVLVNRLTSFTGPLYCNNLQIDLIGYTTVRVHGMTMTDTDIWVITNLGNMGVLLGSASEDTPSTVEISAEYWTRLPLPPSVAPSFDTCNISRRYELEVRVGINYGNMKSSQHVVMTLRHRVQVFSGIAPPAALVAATKNTPFPGPSPLLPIRNPAPVSVSGHNLAGPSHPSPAYPAGDWSSDIPIRHNVQTTTGNEDDAPPSYEEAVGARLPPVQGLRRAYQVSNEGGGMGFEDEDARNEKRRSY